MSPAGYRERFRLAVAGVLAWVWAPLLVAFFIPNDGDVVREGARFIRIMCLAWGGMGIQLCLVSAFRASASLTGCANRVIDTSVGRTNGTSLSQFLNPQFFVSFCQIGHTSSCIEVR